MEVSALKRRLDKKRGQCTACYSLLLHGRKKQVLLAVLKQPAWQGHDQILLGLELGSLPCRSMAAKCGPEVVHLLDFFVLTHALDKGRS